MIVLGLHKDPWHNSGAAMIRDDGDGPRFAYVAEERMDRVKDSRNFPATSTWACMAELGVDSLDEIDMVVMDYIVERSDWRRDHVKTRARTDVFLSDIPAHKIHMVNHHLCHAMAVYYSSSFDDAAILIVDGRGSDHETQSLFHAGPGGITLLESTDTIGIGLLYATVTNTIGFGLLQEGKTMGLAPYGAGIDRHMFDFQGEFDGIRTDYSAVCAEGLYEFKQAPPAIATEQDRARAAWEIQDECERAMLHLAAHARQRTGSPNLCLSGGVALNSVANNRILRSGLFDDIFINPAASDTGIPLGAAHRVSAHRDRPSGRADGHGRRGLAARPAARQAGGAGRRCQRRPAQKERNPTMSTAETITIDPANNVVIVKNGDGEKSLPMDTAEAFAAVSRAWLRCGWDTKYVYSFSWLGRPMIQLPEDMIRLQEVIYAIKPDVIIETGIAHGGSLIFHASLCRAIGNGRVIGIDIEIRPHNRAAIEEHEMFDYITLFEGSSIDPDIVGQVASQVKPGETVLVILDSNHTKEHVLSELEAYGPLVSPDSYIVACDGIMGELTGAPRSNTDWDWNNPTEAARNFTAAHPEFTIDEPVFPFNEGTVQERVTYWPSAYLKRAG